VPTDTPGKGFSLTKKVGPAPAWVWIVGGVGVAYLYQKRKTASSASGTATLSGSSITGTGMVGGTTAAAMSPTNPYSSYQPYGSSYSSTSDLGTVLSTILAQQSAQAGTSPSPGNAAAPADTAVSPGNTTGAPAVQPVVNPYAVGTVVAPGEKIVQSVGAGGGYLDVTNLGGLYTSPGLGVTGSAYSPTAPAGGGSYSAQVSGNTIYEYTPTGVRTFSLTGAPAPAK